MALRPRLALGILKLVTTCQRLGVSLEVLAGAAPQAAAGIGDPEQVITAVLAALGSTDPEDDTCLVALQVL